MGSSNSRTQYGGVIPYMPPELNRQILGYLPSRDALRSTSTNRFAHSYMPVVQSNMSRNPLIAILKSLDGLPDDEAVITELENRLNWLRTNPNESSFNEIREALKYCADVNYSSLEIGMLLDAIHDIVYKIERSRGRRPTKQNRQHFELDRLNAYILNHWTPREDEYHTLVEDLRRRLAPPTDSEDESDY